ncbi:hypothetical protein GCM10027340_12560 [Marinomonas epiphytica]
MKQQHAALEQRQRGLATLEYQVSNVEMYLIESLLIGEGRSNRGVKSLYLLQSEVRFIEEHIQKMPAFTPADYQSLLTFFEGLYGVPDEQVFQLSESKRSELFHVLDELKLLHVSLMRASVQMKADRAALEQNALYYIVSISLLFLLLFLLFATMVSRRLRSGFHTINYHLGKNQYAQSAAAHSLSDEFTDIGSAVAKSSQEKEKGYQLLEQQKRITQQLFQVNNSVELLIDIEDGVQAVSKGFMAFWEQNRESIAEQLGMDATLDTPLGQVVSDVVLFADCSASLQINEAEYVLKVENLNDNLILLQASLEPLSVELDVLRNSLILMANGVWDYPVKVSESRACYPFAVALESLRKQVLNLLNALNDEFKVHGNYEETTKLQQITTYIRGGNNNNKGQPKTEIDSVVVPEVVEHQKQVKGVNVQAFSDVHDNVLLGYETVVQKLDLLAKDLLAEEVLLTNVDQWLQEVMAGVLFGLSSAQEESAQVRNRIAKDLAHDVDTVVEQIEQMKRRILASVDFVESDIQSSYARLESARTNIAGMLEHLGDVSEQSAAKQTSQSEVKSIDSKTAMWDDF